MSDTEHTDKLGRRVSDRDYSLLDQYESKIRSQEAHIMVLAVVVAGLLMFASYLLIWG